jgi:hypothetical protein
MAIAKQGGVGQSVGKLLSRW